MSKSFLKMACAALLLCAASLARAGEEPAKPFELADGDRVVLLGNTFIERDLPYGYFETLLTSRFHDKNITFRNLGWSGDTVWAQARIGNPASAQDGFKILTAHIAELKPTVVFVAYGMSESFDGESGLTEFRKGLARLLDMLDTVKARIALISPIRHEHLGSPLPDPAGHNQDLRLYSDALKNIASQRGCRFVDLFDLLGDGTKAPLRGAYTDNGIHLTAYGYWRAAPLIEQALGLLPRLWRIELDAGGTSRAFGGKLADLKAAPGGVSFKMTDFMLPMPLPPQGAPTGAAAAAQTERMLKVTGLTAGRYALKIDDKALVIATAEQWAKGVALDKGPDYERVEKLRSVIGEKNLLYFHRWRPQNSTYIFGARKKEQGRNAVEIPQFDPLVAEKEAEIAKLRAPVARNYSLERAE